jgi:polysaccharide biosynthesis/export protein
MTPEAFDVAVSVAVSAANSKRYYVIASDPEGRESVHPFPATGSETVVDAVGKLEGLAARATAANIWVARRPAKDGGPEQILPVDWAGITRDGITATNYQLLPGDRVYVKLKE